MQLVEVNKPSLFKGIFDNWKYDFKHNKTIFWLELVGTIGCVIAAGSLGLLAPTPNLLFTYCAYLVGSSTLATAAFKRKNGFWFFLNIFFAVVDIYGITRVLGIT